MLELIFSLFLKFLEYLDRKENSNMKPRNLKKRRKKPASCIESRETQYMCILVLLMLMGIVHVLTHQNEMDFIRNSYALRGIMSSSMSKVGGLFDLETKEMHRLTSNFTIDKDFEKMMPTDREFRDTKYKGENSAERTGQPRNFQRTTTQAEVSIHATSAPQAGSSVHSNNLRKDISKKLGKCKEFGFYVIKNHDIEKFDLNSKAGSTIDECCEYCKATLSCQAVVFSGGDRCWLKKSAAHLIDKPEVEHRPVYVAIGSMANFNRRHIKKEDVVMEKDRNSFAQKLPDKTIATTPDVQTTTPYVLATPFPRIKTTTAKITSTPLTQHVDTTTSGVSTTLFPRVKTTTVVRATNQHDDLLRNRTSVANYTPSIIRDAVSEKNLSQEVTTVAAAVSRSTNESTKAFPRVKNGVSLRNKTSVANYTPSIIRDVVSEKNLSQEVTTVAAANLRSTNDTQNTSWRNITKV